MEYEGTNQTATAQSDLCLRSLDILLGPISDAKVAGYILRMNTARVVSGIVLQ